MRAAWWTPSKIAGKLVFKRGPGIESYVGLGYKRDVDGNLWDVAAIVHDNGLKQINARLISRHPEYYSTSMSDNSDGSMTSQMGELINVWKPYEYEVID